MEIVGSFISFIVGSIVGSFLNVCIWRMPQGISILRPGSFCPSCKRGIKFYDNIPILSYLILRGKCRNCKSKIPIWYFAVECFCAICFLLLYLKFKLYLPYYFLSCYFILLFVTDLKWQIIPDKATYPIFALGLLFSAIEKKFFNNLIAAIILGGLFFFLAFFYYLIRKKEGLGGGDIKLAAVMGVYFGLERGLYGILIGCILGSLIGFFLILLKKLKKNQLIPFGPFLVIGGFCVIFIF